MVRLLTALIAMIMLTGCLTANPERVRARAVRLLTGGGYNAAAVTGDPVLKVLPSAAHVSGEYFKRTGNARTLSGFYSATRTEITISRYAPFMVWLHEYEHYFLHKLGIPIAEHHGIMRKL